MDLNQFHTRLKNNPRPVMVDLWAPWCGPCKAMEPVLKQAAAKYEGQVDLWKINADKSPDVARALKVMSIPTYIGFANGEEIVRRTGVQPLQSLDLMFDATLHQKTDVILPPSTGARLLRSGLGIVLLGIGWSQDQSIVLLGLGGLLLFSAFYDRCPIFRMVAPRIKELLRGSSGRALTGRSR